MRPILRPALPLTAAPLAANTRADPVGDVIPSYAGPLAGDLDVIRVSAQYRGTFVRLTSLHEGPVGATAGSPSACRRARLGSRHGHLPAE